MKELLTIITIGTVLFAFACGLFELITQWQTRRKLDRLAANQRRTSQDLEAMRLACKKLDRLDAENAAYRKAAK